MSQRFLSARRLGITTAEHRALIRVAEVIGASPFIPDDEIHDDDDGEAMTGLGFNMAFQAQPADCGTVLCVGGHVSLAMQGVDLSQEHLCITAEQRAVAKAYVNRSDPAHRGMQPLSALYWPGHTINGQASSEVMDHARPGDAVHAIRNFLTTGKPEWEAVIRQRQETEQ